MKFPNILLILLLLSLRLLAGDDFSKGGIGFDIGARIWYPTEINEFLEYKWDEMTEDYWLVTEMGSEQMITGMGVRLRGAILPIKQIMLEPYADLFWSGKLLTVSGGSTSWTNYMDYTGGLNFYGRFNSDKVVNFKLGTGVYAGYSRFTCDMWAISMGGFSRGINALAGIDITLKKVIITVTFKAPIGYTDLEMKDEGAVTDADYPFAKIPSRVYHMGLEIRPGVIFRF